LNQTRPTPVVVQGWSRADSVEGSKNPDYALYVDLLYTDGTPLWGQSISFSVGTHDWERRQVTIYPQKPIKSISVYAMFRNHAGTVWFDDLHAFEISGTRLFDGQSLAFPLKSRLGTKPVVFLAGKDGLTVGFNEKAAVTSVSSGGQEVGGAYAGGFFARDVAVNSALTPLNGRVKPRNGGGADFTGTFGDLRLGFQARITLEGNELFVDAQLRDAAKEDRAVTLYFCLPLEAMGWKWGKDIREAEAITTGREYSGLVPVSVGATGSLSLYPFSTVWNGQHALGIANQQDWPSVFRLFYNGNAKQLVIAWDFALTDKSATWSPRTARGRCTLFRIAPNLTKWGFRAATQRLYQRHPSLFARRARADGIWIPFTDPAIVPNVEDFGIAYHEGDNSLKSDDAKGILSFRYTEPSTYWMPMPPEMPRTYANALKLLEKNAKEGTGEARDFARAVLNSGTQDADGKFNLEFQNQPWANGAVFLLNPNPELPNTPENPTKASLSYNFAKASAMYSPAAKATRGEQDGEYLDSVESWNDVLDFRPQHLQACPYPLTFETDTRRPAVPQWFALYTFARYLRDDLKNRNRLLMANTTPVRFSIFAPLMDVMGIEVNWLLGDGEWRPDSDATFNLRRTMSAKKPYLLLMNSDFDKFDANRVERYFQTCLFYGVFPSFFSVDAASNPYWDNPKWRERDRPLFKKYMPLFRKISGEGWEVLTFATSSNPQVGVERFGRRHFTLRNFAFTNQEARIVFDVAALRLGNTPLRAFDALTGREIACDKATFSIALEPEQTVMVRLQE
jgi:hypothetical protein